MHSGFGSIESLIDNDHVFYACATDDAGLRLNRNLHNSSGLLSTLQARRLTRRSPNADRTWKHAVWYLNKAGNSYLCRVLYSLVGWVLVRYCISAMHNKTNALLGYAFQVIPYYSSRLQARKRFPEILTAKGRHRRRRKATTPARPALHICQAIYHPISRPCYSPRILSLSLLAESTGGCYDRHTFLE